MQKLNYRNTVPTGEKSGIDSFHHPVISFCFILKRLDCKVTHFLNQIISCKLGKYTRGNNNGKKSGRNLAALPSFDSLYLYYLLIPLNDNYLIFCFTGRMSHHIPHNFLWYGAT